MVDAAVPTAGTPVTTVAAVVAPGVTILASVDDPAYSDDNNNYVPVCYYKWCSQMWCPLITAVDKVLVYILHNVI